MDEITGDAGRGEKEFMKVSRCRSCGAEIIWIKTQTGKSMPVDSERIYYTPKTNGLLKLVTPDGRVISAEPDPSSTVWAYVSHFATCPYADRHRK